MIAIFFHVVTKGGNRAWMIAITLVIGPQAFEFRPQCGVHYCRVGHGKRLRRAKAHSRALPNPVQHIRQLAGVCYADQNRIDIVQIQQKGQSRRRNVQTGFAGTGPQFRQRISDRPEMRRQRRGIGKDQAFQERRSGMDFHTALFQHPQVSAFNQALVQNTHRQLDQIDWKTVQYQFDLIGRIHRGSDFPGNTFRAKSFHRLEQMPASRSQQVVHLVNQQPVYGLDAKRPQRTVKFIDQRIGIRGRHAIVRKRRRLGHNLKPMCRRQRPAQNCFGVSVGGRRIQHTHARRRGCRKNFGYPRFAGPGFAAIDGVVEPELRRTESETAQIAGWRRRVVFVVQGLVGSGLGVVPVFAGSRRSGFSNHRCVCGYFRFQTLRKVTNASAADAPHSAPLFAASALMLSRERG